MVPLLARYPYSIALFGVYVSPGITWVLSLMNSLQKFAPAEKNTAPPTVTMNFTDTLVNSVDLNMGQRLVVPPEMVMIPTCKFYSYISYLYV